MTDPLITDLHAARERFLALVAEIRPELHRYCARMAGSAADGEDIVQDTLARAYYALAELDELPPLRPWIFRIAHGRAIDHLRRYERRMGRPLESIDEPAADATFGPEEPLARDEATRAALTRFAELPPSPRSCVILKDVLGHSLEEIATLLELSEPAVKAALHRGRGQLRALRPIEDAPPPRPSPAVVRYAALFNARDWPGVRALLAEDVRLDLVGRVQRQGRRDVSSYTANYEVRHDWHFVPAWVDGREALAAFRSEADASPSYFVLLAFEDGAVESIRDFRYVPYIADEASIVLTAPR